MTKKLDNWIGSRRRIDFITPDTFSKKIILVSTTINSHSGETARTNVKAMNYFDIGDEIKPEKHWKVIKQHKSFVEAMKFHDKYVNGLTFADTVNA